MKLTEFVEKLKNYKQEIFDMPAKNPVDPSKCTLCKKAFKGGERDVVSDLSGTLFHRECFDNLTSNTEIKKRRTDNQLPYEF
jgi:hypothetical protein